MSKPRNLSWQQLITVSAVRAIMEWEVRVLTASQAKAKDWLAQNLTMVTALNPLIGYRLGAEPVTEAAEHHLTITISQWHQQKPARVCMPITIGWELTKK